MERVYPPGLKIIVAILQQTVLNFVSHLPKHKNRRNPEPPLLVRAERLIKRLPRVGETFELGRSLSQSIGTSMQEVDRIAVFQGFDGVLLAQLADPRFTLRQASLPSLVQSSSAERT